LTEIPDNLKQPLIELLFAIADDKLMLGHRNSDWTGLAPFLEEDIAFSAFAQDDIAHAQAIYEYVGKIIGNSADELAFGRDPQDYRCASVVEIPDEFNWATALGRLFVCGHFNYLRFKRLSNSSIEDFAALCSRMCAEQQISVEHVDEWLDRLGRGTAESGQNMQDALKHLEPIAPMLLEPTEGQQLLEEAGVYPPLDQDMFERWRDDLKTVTKQAGLKFNLQAPDPNIPGGRRGEHSDSLSELHNEMTEVYRVEPGAKW